MWKKHKIAGIIAAMICESYHELGKSFPSLCKVSTLRVLLTKFL